MRILWSLLALWLAAVTAAGAASAAVVGDARVPYSATRTITIDGQRYLDKVFHVPGKEREEVDIGGIPMDFILDLDRHHAAIILPALVSYLEIPLPPLLDQLDRRLLDGDAVAEERIDGIRATKYRLDYTASDGTRGVGFLWLSRDNILLGIEGRLIRPHHRPTRIGMRLSNLRLGPQPHSLFQVPKGLHRVPAGALSALLNLGGRHER